MVEKLDTAYQGDIPSKFDHYLKEIIGEQEQKLLPVKNTTSKNSVQELHTLRKPTFEDDALTSGLKGKLHVKKNPTIQRERRDAEISQISQAGELVSRNGNQKNRKPPLDLFGIHPKFYISGDTKIQSWVGCFLSSLQIATLCLIMVVFVKAFLAKSSPNISMSNTIDDKANQINLQENRQILSMPYYIFGIDPKKLFNVTAW